MDDLARTFLSAVATYTCGIALITAGILHLANPRGARRSLSSQRLWPSVLEQPLLVLLTLAELTIGTFLIIGRFAGWLPLMPVALLASSSLLLTFALYAGILLKLRPGVSCACDGEDEPVSVWTIVRALLLVGLSFVALSTSDAGSVLGLLERPAESFGFSVACILAAIVWQLPSALSQKSHAAAPRYRHRFSAEPALGRGW